MRAAIRRLERLEAVARRQCAEPETFIYLPHNGRDKRPPGHYRVGSATLVLYVPGGADDPNSPEAGAAPPPGDNLH